MTLQFPHYLLIDICSFFLSDDDRLQLLGLSCQSYRINQKILAKIQLILLIKQRESLNSRIAILRDQLSMVKSRELWMEINHRRKITNNKELFSDRNRLYNILADKVHEDIPWLEERNYLEEPQFELLCDYEENEFSAYVQKAEIEIGLLEFHFYLSIDRYKGYNSNIEIEFLIKNENKIPIMISEDEFIIKDDKELYHPYHIDQVVKVFNTIIESVNCFMKEALTIDIPRIIIAT